MYDIWDNCLNPNPLADCLLIPRDQLPHPINRKANEAHSVELLNRTAWNGCWAIARGLFRQDQENPNVVVETSVFLGGGGWEKGRTDVFYQKISHSQARLLLAREAKNLASQIVQGAAE